MSKNTRQNENNDGEQVGEAPFEEFTENDGFVDPSYLARINSFLAMSKADVSEATCYLYKYDNYTSGEAKSILHKYEGGDIPDSDEVGKQWGSGRFLLVLGIPASGGRKALMRAYKFRINPVYDLQRTGSPVQQVSHDSGKNGMAESFTMLQGLLAMLIPLFQRPSESPDMSKILMGNYDLFGGLMKKQMMENIELMNDYQRKLQLVREGAEMKNDEEGEDQAETIIDQIKPLLAEWLPKLIGGGKEAKVVSKIVRDTRMFKEIAKNQNMVRALISFIDKEKGRDEADKVLASLGMQRIRGR